MDSDIKEYVTRIVREKADALDWLHLTIAERTQHYKAWTEDPQIGGLLAQVMDPSTVRVYLKDTVMGRHYTQPRRPQLKTLLSTLGVPCYQVTREYIKPQALLCDGSCLYTITVAKEWKNSLLITFERGCETKHLNRSVLFITDHSIGRFVDKTYRSMIDEAGRRLGIEVEWVT